MIVKQMYQEITVFQIYQQIKNQPIKMVAKNFLMILLILSMIQSFGLHCLSYKTYYIHYVDFLTNCKRILLGFMKFYIALLILPKSLIVTIIPNLVQKW